MLSNLMLAVVLVSFLPGGAANAQEESKIDVEKRIVPAFDCSSATYATTLYDFISTYECYPSAWKYFFELDEVKKEIELISGKLISKHKESKAVQPALPHIFRALNLVAPDNVKVVILGQDPTPQEGMATGLAFSLMPGQDPATVPSVFNILLELKLEGVNVGFDNGDLSPWVAQGVLLLNSALTVEVGKANSHRDLWKTFTRQLVEFTSSRPDVEPPPKRSLELGSPKVPRLVWLLWGVVAKSFFSYIAKDKGHYVIQGNHPSSEFAAYINFLGGKYFLCANTFLESNRGGGIHWALESKRPIMRECPAIN